MLKGKLNLKQEFKEIYKEYEQNKKSNCQQIIQSQNEMKSQIEQLQQPIDKQVQAAELNQTEITQYQVEYNKIITEHNQNMKTILDSRSQSILKSEQNMTDLQREFDQLFDQAESLIEKKQLKTIITQNPETQNIIDRRIKAVDNYIKVIEELMKTHNILLIQNFLREHKICDIGIQYEDLLILLKTLDLHDQTSANASILIQLYLIHYSIIFNKTDIFTLIQDQEFIFAATIMMRPRVFLFKLDQEKLQYYENFPDMFKPFAPLKHLADNLKSKSIKILQFYTQISLALNQPDMIIEQLAILINVLLDTENIENKTTNICRACAYIAIILEFIKEMNQEIKELGIIKKIVKERYLEDIESVNHDVTDCEICRLGKPKYIEQLKIQLE